MEEKDKVDNPAVTTSEPAIKDEKKDVAGDQPKTFTQEDLDKVLSKRLNEEKERNNKELQDALKKEREEWERQSKLSQEEREKELLAKEQQRQKDRERVLTLRENRLSGIEKLSEFKMPGDFIDFVIDEDLDKMTERIANLNKLWSKAIEEAVSDRVKGNPPKDIPTNKNFESGKEVKNYF